MSIRKVTGIWSLLLLLAVTGCSIFDKTTSPASSYFMKYYGGDGFQTGIDVVYNSSDQSFIILGTTQRNSSPDTSTRLLLVKADKNGNLLWQSKPFGGAFGNEARDVEITKDGNIVVLGNSYVDLTGNQRTILVARYQQSGSFIDSKTFTPADGNGSSSTNDGDGQTITELNQGGFIVAGSAATPGTSPLLRDAILLRLDNSLGIYNGGVWKTVLGNSPSLPNGSKGIATQVIQVNDSVFFRFGYVVDTSGTRFDYQMVALDKTGEPTQQLTVGTATSNDVLGSTVMLTSTAIGINYYLAGISTSANNSSDVFTASFAQTTNGYEPALVKTGNSKLGLNLQTPLQASAKILHPTASIAVSSSSGLLVLTNENTNSTEGMNWVLIRLKQNLEPDWSVEKTFGGVGDDFCGSVLELPDRRIIMTGTMSLNGESKMTLIKVNSDGQFAD